MSLSARESGNASLSSDRRNRDTHVSHVPSTSPFYSKAACLTNFLLWVSRPFVASHGTGCVCVANLARESFKAIDERSMRSEMASLVPLRILNDYTASLFVAVTPYLGRYRCSIHIQHDVAFQPMLHSAGVGYVAKVRLHAPFNRDVC